MYVRSLLTHHYNIIFLLEWATAKYIHVVEYSECLWMLACFGKVCKDQWRLCTNGHQVLQTACSDRGTINCGIELPSDR